MKQYTVEYTVGAQLDIADAQVYIENNFGDPINAYKIAMGLFDACDGLEVFPRRAAVRVHMNGHGLRFLRKGKHTIVYYIDGDKVVIHAVFYSRRDILAALKERE